MQAPQRKQALQRNAGPGGCKLRSGKATGSSGADWGQAADCALTSGNECGSAHPPNGWDAGGR
jgi:hypothetical protein